MDIGQQRFQRFYFVNLFSNSRNVRLFTHTLVSSKLVIKQILTDICIAIVVFCQFSNIVVVGSLIYVNHGLYESIKGNCILFTVTQTLNHVKCVIGNWHHYLINISSNLTSKTVHC